jgi:hypothetical protein
MMLPTTTKLFMLRVMPFQFLDTMLGTEKPD